MSHDGRIRICRSRRARRRFLHHLAVVVALFVGLPVLVQHWFGVFTNVREARTFVGSFDLWAPLVFVVLQALQVVVAPVPGQILAVLAAVGRAPAFFLVNVLGDLVWTGIRGLAAFVLALVVALSAVGRYYRERLVADLTQEPTIGR